MDKIKRRFFIGDRKIGEGEILLQGMIKGNLKKFNEIKKEIDKMIEEDVDLIRVAVPDKKSIEYVEKIVKYSKVPIIADIHFNAELAILSIDVGVKKIRLNPSNIKERKDIEKVVLHAKHKGIPIRVGANVGSLVYEKKEGERLKIMLEAIEREVKILEEFSFFDIVISAKSEDPIETIKINEILYEKFNYPIHIGVTAAGSDEDGIIKSTIGISNLLLKGIGDTIRVSLSNDSSYEVKIGRKILENLSLRKRSRIEIISCPKCSRCNKNFDKILKDIKDNFSNLKIPIKLAVMGCEVNAIGEAKDADLGIAMTRGKILFFKNGKMIKTLEENEIVPFLKRELLKKE
ncbi:MAG: (E)-4-hydroxy-3-methylbut-2-enyl-diphosphate synthase [Caldisericia bacterium]|jgi:(E)-4-hydroxy-3-methylbut-2-enyl-diphosphate synthase|nr:(E)-4-hydroxy-3-methylbut-2-enyl-diphosphate synthase [Caldisericia bacterium]